MLYSSREKKNQNHEAFAATGWVCRLEIRELCTKCYKPSGGSAPKIKTVNTFLYDNDIRMCCTSLHFIQNQYQILTNDESLKYFFKQRLGALKMCRYPTIEMWIIFRHSIL